ncbi:MAG: hypothetical protein H0U49_02510 [Parachlamydiaceae bacterium]|nr:hypothetical protein [Parachlamydiaceae bacterium]
MNIVVDFSKNEVLPRLNYLVGAPIALTYRAIDIAIGAVGGLAAICTLGMHRETTNFAAKHLSSSKHLLSTPYFHLLRVINPNAKLDTNKLSIMDSRLFSRVGRIDDAAYGYSSSNNFLERHVCSRLSYALLAISCTIEGIANGLIGIPTVLFSILTLGKFSSINNVAYDSLSKTSGTIGDLFFCAIKLINPQTNTSLLLF